MGEGHEIVAQNGVMSEDLTSLYSVRLGFGTDVNSEISLVINRLNPKTNVNIRGLGEQSSSLCQNTIAELIKENGKFRYNISIEREVLNEPVSGEGSVRNETKIRLKSFKVVLTEVK